MAYAANSITFSSLILSLSTYWVLYLASADYTTRFSTDGVDHRLFFMAFSVAIFFVDLNWTGDILANGDEKARRMHLTGIAICYLLNSVVFGRAAVWVTEGRNFAVFHTILNLSAAALYLVAAHSSDWTCKALCWCACALFFLRSYGLPNFQKIDKVTNRRNAKDYISRSQSMMIASLALLIKSISKSVGPGRLEGHMGSLLLMSLLLVFLVKTLMFDNHVEDTNWHAVRCVTTPWRPTIFLSCVPLAMAGVMMMASGCNKILQMELQTSDENADMQHWAADNLMQGLALMLVFMAAMRALHKRPPVSDKGAMTIWKVQIVGQLLVAAVAHRMHYENGVSALKRCVFLIFLLVLLNLADEAEEMLHYRTRLAAKAVKLHGSNDVLEKAMEKPSPGNEIRNREV